ncbi:MAG: hypothetical protein ACTHNU_13625 [Gaiellales bacterium]
MSTIELGKPRIHQDPADPEMVLADFPLNPAPDTDWLAIFSVRVAASAAASAWSVTGRSIRLRTPATRDALSAGIAALREVVAQTTADYDTDLAAGRIAGAPDALHSLQEVVDDAFPGPV